MAAPHSDLVLRKRDLFRLIGYEPHAGQVLVHRSKASRRILACGVRWGKSTCGAMEAIAALLEPRETSLGWLVAPSYDNADRIFERVHYTLQRHFAHRVKEISEREHKIVVRNFGGGLSELRTKSAEHPVALLGEGLDWLIVDEAARLKREIWEQYLAQRLIDKRGTALLLSTPAGCNWFHALYRKGQSGKVPGYESWRSPSWENPHLDRAVIDGEREHMSQEDFDQEFGAEFLGEKPEPCEVCGGPREGACSTVVIVGPNPNRCAACEGIVHKDGRTAVSIYKGKPYTYIIQLPEEIDDEYRARAVATGTPFHDPRT